MIDLPENGTDDELKAALNALKEDIFADAYAGINAFSAHAEKFRQAARTVTEQYRSGYTAKAARQAQDAQRTAEKYSIGEIADESGNNYGRGVRLDSTLLENLTDRERVQMVKERVKELGGKHFTAYDSHGNEVNVQIAEPNARFVNKSGKSVPVNKDLTTKNRNSYYFLIKHFK